MANTIANDALRSAVGFAMKAGKLANGDFSVDKAVRSGKAKLVIVDSCASSNTAKRWKDAAVQEIFRSSSLRIWAVL